MELRKLTKADWPDVKDIYSCGIATGIATFENEVPSWEIWDKNHLAFARFVAMEEEKVVGWVALSKVTDRCVYQGVAEVSVYVHPEFSGRGFGRFLMHEMITESETQGIWTLQSGIFPENVGSIELHKKTGFRTIGYRERVAMKDGVWKDNVLMERRSRVVGL